MTSVSPKRLPSAFRPGGGDVGVGANLARPTGVYRPGGTAMFVRFVSPSPHEDSHCLTGIFYTAWRVRERGLFCEAERDLCDGILDWFNCHLPFPDRFSRSKSRKGCGKAVCWFKDGAARHIRRVRALAALLGRHGVWVEMLWTGRPGYVVYEDEYQVAAVPFRGTRA